MSKGMEKNLHAMRSGAPLGVHRGLQKLGQTQWQRYTLFCMQRACLVGHQPDQIPSRTPGAPVRQPLHCPSVTPELQTGELHLCS